VSLPHGRSLFGAGRVVAYWPQPVWCSCVVASWPQQVGAGCVVAYWPQPVWCSCVVASWQQQFWSRLCRCLLAAAIGSRLCRCLLAAACLFRLCLCFWPQLSKAGCVVACWPQPVGTDCDVASLCSLFEGVLSALVIVHPCGLWAGRRFHQDEPQGNQVFYQRTNAS
jgi:hypothetical protein